MSKRTSVFLVVLAGVLWGIISIFVNALSEIGFLTAQISFLRVFSSAILMLFFLLIYDKELLKISARDIWMFVGTGIISLTIFSYCYFTTIVNVEASIAVSLLYTSPAFILIFSAIVFKERINATKIVAIILTICGSAFVSGIIGTNSKMSALEFVIGLCAGLFYALYSIFARFATKKYHPLTITFYTFVFASIGLFIMSSPSEMIGTLAKSPKSIITIVLSGIICGIIPYITYTTGLKNLSTTYAGILVAVEPLVASLLGIIGYHESTDFFKILGIVLILSSILIISIAPKEKKMQ